MRSPVEHIRLSKQARDQLITLKRSTGIKNWNTLCRWAFCMSLSEPMIPTLGKSGAEQGVEMTWSVFAGEYSDTLGALLKLRCHRDGLSADEATWGNYLRAHIHRGLGFLSADKRIRSIVSLVSFEGVQHVLLTRKS
jgi:DNA sulfur modification protein DndE